MTGPVFPDCPHPDNCQCAGRGYEHEADGCVFTSVQASAASLGVTLPPAPPASYTLITDAVGMVQGFQLSGEDARRISMAPVETISTPTASMPRTSLGAAAYGSHVVLRDQRGDTKERMADTLHWGLERLGYEEWFEVPTPTVFELLEMWRKQEEEDGLRAEAGHAVSRVRILASSRATLRPGLVVLVWISLMRSADGDALSWLVGVSGRNGAGRDGNALTFGTLAALQTWVDHLALAAGSPEWEHFPIEAANDGP